MTEKKTLQDVRDSVDHMIAERGADYVYKKPDSNMGCLYVHYRGTEKATAGCGVGWIVNDLFGELVPRHLEGSSPSIHSGGYWTDRFEEPAIYFLDYFQTFQDKEAMYRECLVWTEEALTDATGV